MNKDKIKNSSISVVMYHYVREIKNSKYPNLKGLEYKTFKKQIDYFCKNFNILNNNDFIDIISSQKIPSKPSILLTFDDGYIDHYKYVFPYLKKKKIQGIFYPPKKVIENKIVLDVNKIHFILEKEQNRKKILTEIKNYLKRKNYKISIDKVTQEIDLRNRWDDKETILIKRLLQFYLPRIIREKTINHLFKKILNTSLKSFSKKIYMNSNHLKEMFSENMSFGSHGVNHRWMEHLTKKEQEKEIKDSINYFTRLKIVDKNFSFCYPYGSFNQVTINLLKKYNISYSFTTKPKSINRRNISNYFTYPRFDTNDFIF